MLQWRWKGITWVHVTLILQKMGGIQSTKYHLYSPSQQKIEEVDIQVMWGRLEMRFTKSLEIYKIFRLSPSYSSYEKSYRNSLYQKKTPRFIWFMSRGKENCLAKWISFSVRYLSILRRKIRQTYVHVVRISCLLTWLQEDLHIETACYP